MALDKFGKLLRDIRVTRSLLLKDMADDLGMSSAELSAIETGKKDVPDDFISRVAELYNTGDSCAQLLRTFEHERYRIKQGLWCEWQIKDNEGICCTAHLHEGRAFSCPYENSKARLKAQYPCSDYHEIGKIL